MWIGLLAACVSLGLGHGAEPTAAPLPLPLPEWRDRINAYVSQPRFSGAAWGVKIIGLDTGTTLFETNAQRLFKPASNNKLFTAALALNRLGTDRRIVTTVLARTAPDRDGTVRGDVIVVGRGDPSFAARFHGGDHAKSLLRLVEALIQGGVRRIEGDLIGDESFFRGPPFGSSWTWDDLQYYYGAEVSALSAEDNTLDLELKPGARVGDRCVITFKPSVEQVQFENQTLTVTNGGVRQIDLYRAPGSSVVRVTGRLPLGDKAWSDAVAVPEPAKMFLRLLKADLMKRGVTVTGQLRTVGWPERELQPLDPASHFEIARVESPPVSELVVRMMKLSQNLYAQLVFLQCGEAGRGPSDREPSSEDLGMRELRAFMKGVDVPVGEVLIEEGSGLSRGALVTPHAIVALLHFMDRHPQAAVFRDSLPVAGVDGTLKSRMKNTPAAGVLCAKTGTLRYVNTLSGYTVAVGGERLAFSLLLNNYRPPGTTSGRDAVDGLAVLLMTLGSIR